jgi:16S rRNA (cytidine1402-2'-O)-methyltransferase
MSSENLQQIESLPAGLYLVATPIGNLRDITLRALDILHAADMILCEDTRVTKKLLSAYGIRTPVQAYHEHSDDSVRTKMISLIERGKAIALVSDAGMPLMSDPGFKLVRAVKEKDLYLTSLPGANAYLMALQLSGLPCEKFTFLGFLPPKSGARKNMLKEWAHSPATFGFYEAKQRVLKTLSDIAEILGEAREICVARELTKKFEEVISGSVKDLLYELQGRDELKGEFVILIAPDTTQENAQEDIESDIRTFLENGEKAKAISEILAEKYNLPRSHIYDLILQLKNTP